MANLSVIKELCSERSISLKTLASRVNISEMGLQRIIKTNSTSIRTIEKIADVLEVPISVFFISRNKISPVQDFITSPLAEMLRNRLNKLSDKLNLMKDHYVWEVLHFIHVGMIPPYPFAFIENKKPLDIYDTETEQKILSYIKKSPKVLTTPFSKMEPDIVKLLTSSEYFLETFYFTIFSTNVLNITDYLNDGLIKDKEMVKYWEEWKAIEPDIAGVLINTPYAYG